MELSRLTWADISQGTTPQYAGSWLLHVREGKGKKNRWVQLPGNVISDLQAWRIRVLSSGYPASPDSPILFAMRGRIRRLTTRRLQQDAEQAFADCGIIGHSVHDMRHTFATHLWLAAGENISIVQKLLGHDRIETTCRYIQGLSSSIGKALENLYKIKQYL